MTKLKFYQFAAVGLLLLNLVMLGFFFLRPAGPVGDPLKLAREALRLDTDQQERFTELAMAHSAEMRNINARQSAILAAHFGQLTDLSTSSPTPLPAEHGELERRKVEITYAHFEEVRSLLRPEQESLFPGFVEDVLRRVLGNSSSPRE